MLYDLDQIRTHYRDMLKDKPRDYYERFDPFILDKRPIVRKLMAQNFRQLFPEKVPVLLDVGCGTGFYFPLLSEHVETLYGIDLSIPMLAQAEELIEQKGLMNCYVKEASALELPFADSSVDVVFSWDFLHHVPNVKQSAAEITRVLKPGGRYVAVEPNLINPSILKYHVQRRCEWGLLSKNQFTNRPIFAKNFDISVSYNNTIISFLNQRTLGLWKFINSLTSIGVFKYLSFRYIMQGTKRDYAQRR